MYVYIYLITPAVLLNQLAFNLRIELDALDRCHLPGGEVLKSVCQRLQSVGDRSRHSDGHPRPLIVAGSASGRACTVGWCYRRSHEQDDHGDGDGGEHDGGYFGSHIVLR